MDEILKEKQVDLEEEKKEVPGEDSALSESETATGTEASIPELNNTPTPVAEPETEPTPAPKTFTQEEVNELMGQVRAETRDRTFKYVYGRYGVEDESGLDDLIGNAQRYDTLKETTDADRAAWDEERKGFSAKEEQFHHELCDLKEKLALLESGIDPQRYEDAKFILKGKGLEITAETIKDELATHPEWKKEEEKKTYTPEEPVESQPEIKVPEVPNVLGNENGGLKAPEKSDEDIAMEKYFKIK